VLSIMGLLPLIFWFHTFEMLVWIGEDAATAALSAEFVHRLMPGLAPLVAFLVLTKWLSAQGVLMPIVWASVAANLVNIGANFGLIALMGFNGCPIATTLSRYFLFISLLVYVMWRKPYLRHGTWPRWSNAVVFDRRGLWKMATLSVSGGVMFASEAWFFEVTTLLSGLLGSVSLNAHACILQVASFSFVACPLGLAVAASVRVGQLLGANNAYAAKRAALMALGVVVAFMSSCGLAIVAARHDVGRLFSNDDAVLDLVSRVILLAALFQVCDGTQGVENGILR
jgi:MATE family multidrug resistance protein